MQGNINLIKAAVAKGVKRFVLVTSIGTGDSKDAPPKQVYDVLEKVLVEKAKAEEYLVVRSWWTWPVSLHNSQPWMVVMLMTGIMVLCCYLTSCMLLSHHSGPPIYVAGRERAAGV